MPISIVVGGQFGSEGKGKVAHHLAKEKHASVAVRCGGTNSGHTVIDEENNAQVFRQLPTAAILPEVNLALCAGTCIDIDILMEEVARANVDDKRLSIDPYAVVITRAHKEIEIGTGLVEEIASTGSGTGAAVIGRIQRSKDVIFAKDIPEIRNYISNVNEELRSRLLRNQRIIIEGTQGFGLSPLHSGLNPYVTSRDTTAASFLSEVGLSPFDVDEIAMVIRAFPIRVGGNSGPLPKETNWESITQKANCSSPICEWTSVTKHVRRVAQFDKAIVLKAIQANSPTSIFLNHLDYCQDSEELVDKIEKELVSSIDWLGYGPASIIPRKNEVEV